MDPPPPPAPRSRPLSFTMTDEEDELPPRPVAGTSTRVAFPFSPTRTAGNAPPSRRRRSLDGGPGSLDQQQQQPQGLSPAFSLGKRKTSEWGDRFIPTRDGGNLSAAFQLHGDSSSPSSASKKKMRTGGAREIDVARDESYRAFSEIIKNEILLNTSPSQNSSQTSPCFGSPSASPYASSGADRSPLSSTGNYPYRAPNGVPTPARKRLLTYSSPAMPSRQSSSLEDPFHEAYSTSPVTADLHRQLLHLPKPPRTIMRSPFRVLDAPDLADDYYVNMIDWGSTNVLSVGLGSCVWLWSANTSKVTKLCDVALSRGGSAPSSTVARSPGGSSTVARSDGAIDEEAEEDALVGGMRRQNEISSVCWRPKGNVLAVGTQEGIVQIWDAERCKLIRTMEGHGARVGALAWLDPNVLSSGSKDHFILHRDLRAPAPFFRSLHHHRQEVCALRWSPEGTQLASGGNDNKLFIWEGTEKVDPIWRFSEHLAAVRALAWNPHQRGILASGGGSSDRKIRFYNTLTGSLLSSHETGSQVCNLVWSKTSSELVSTHGYTPRHLLGGGLDNAIRVWKWPSMTEVATLTGHTYRVLFLSMSPDGQTICTGSGDETLRFWNVFQKDRRKWLEPSALNPFSSKIR